MIGTGFTAQSEVCQGECSRQFGYQFLNTIGVITKTLAQFAIAAVCSGSPMAVVLTRFAGIG